MICKCIYILTSTLYVYNIVIVGEGRQVCPSLSRSYKGKARMVEIVIFYPLQKMGNLFYI